MIFLSRSIDGVCILLDGPFKIFHTYILTSIVFIIGPFTLRTIKSLSSTIFANRRDRLAKQIRRMLIPQLIF